MQGHAPVLPREVLEYLAPRDGARYLDATFGGGGHTRSLLETALTSVVALDCDPDAVARGRELETLFPGRFSIRDGNFRNLSQLTEGGFDGILFDFGVSSFQLDQAPRGFSFSKPAPADMRLDPRKGQSAASFLESAPRESLVHAIRDYGEEPHWRRIVQAIEGARGTGRLSRTDSLAACISDAIPVRDRMRSRIHPATRSFQGIRIAVNGELDAIEQALPEAFAKLNPGGVLATISFHSLEDRLAKRWFRRFAGLPEDENDHRPADLRVRLGELLTRKPVQASESEIASNPRARSARLRALRKS